MLLSIGWKTKGSRLLTGIKPYTTGLNLGFFKELRYYVFLIIPKSDGWFIRQQDHAKLNLDDYLWAKRILCCKNYGKGEVFVTG